MSLFSVFLAASVVSAYGANLRRDNTTNSTTSSSSIAISQSLQLGEAIINGIVISRLPEPAHQLATADSSTAVSITSLSSSTSNTSTTSSSVSASSTSLRRSASDGTISVVATRSPIPISRSSAWTSNFSITAPTSNSPPGEGKPHRESIIKKNYTTTFFEFDNGTGSVSSCYTSIWKWWLASTSSAASLNATTFTEYVTTSTYSTQSVPYDALTSVTPLESPPRVTTLCDGQPRLIGSAKEAATTDVGTTVYTVSETSYQPIPNYPPIPCTIAPSPCSSLWSVYARSRASQQPLTTLLPPACPYLGEELDLQAIWQRMLTPPLIQAASAQLHFWPVRLANPSAAQKNSSGGEFCKGLANLGWTTNAFGIFLPQNNYPTPATAASNITQIRTAVVGGVTITSPTVAVEFFTVKNFARDQDSTYSTVVVTMPPDQLKTFREFDQSSKGLHTMAYNDLNWICQDKQHPDGPWTTQDAQGPDCYQNVPAAAYFAANERSSAVGLLAGQNSSVMPSITMLNDYRPFVVPGDEYTDVITSLYGPLATWMTFGAMDPPSALTQVNDPLTPVAATAVPTAVAAVTTNPASTIQAVPTINAPPSVTPLSTAKTTQAQKTTETNLPDPPKPTVKTTDQAQAQNNNNQQVSNNTPQQAAEVNDNQQSAGGSQLVQPVPQQAAEVNDNQQSAGGSQLVQPVPQTTAISIGGTTVSAVAAGSNVIVGGTTIAQGAAATIAGQQVSVASQGALVIGTGAAASTVAIPVNTPLSVNAVAPGVVAVSGQTLTNGGAVKTLSDGQQISLASTGIVVVSPATAAPQPQLITIGSQIVTASSLSPNVAVIASQTLSVGGAPGSFGGQQLSLASNGIVIGTGSTAVTMPLASATNTGNGAGSGSIQVGSDVLTLAASNSNVFANAHTTFTLSAGGSAVTLNGQTLSAASSGVYLVVSGGKTSTVTFAKASGSATQASSTGSSRLDSSLSASKTAASSSNASTTPGSRASRMMSDDQWMRQSFMLVATTLMAVFML